MIHFMKEQNTFYLNTQQTTYVIHINEHNHLEHVYYGPKIKPFSSINDVLLRYEFELGSSTSYSKDAKGYMLNHIPLEISSFGKGDYREPTIHLELANGSRTIDLIYKSHKIIKNKHIKGMPQVKKNESLEILLEDSLSNIQVYLYYSLFENEDSIIRNIEIVNNNKEDIILDKALSFNLDMMNKDYILSKLDGAWIRERHIEDVPLCKGTIRFDSKKGVSSSDHNPFFLIKEKTTLEDYGSAYAFGLIYSGNFEANIEISSHNLLRINMGINAFDFRYRLGHKERFITPEAILSYSGHGISQLSNQLHKLINNHIISNHKERPIIVNNWEATYFDFNQKKLLAIAKKAKKLGMELFCLDDGWFARRNDDFSSLGDWHYNQKKLPRGVKGFAEKINKLGLDFGLWVEPEMVNEDSDLYREHPDWAVRLPDREPSLGRNQLILDLSNPRVRNYLKDTLIDLFKSAPISYVKWDMNRNFSDVYSAYLDNKDQGQFYHLYILGLYDILETLTQTFPDILFESCSSGGNRFDLGISYYMPQTWTSDNTDAYERVLIQEGTSYFYPLSTISNHVSGDRSHQTLRHTPLESRFNVACFGVLGYELDLSKLTPFDEKVIEKQISFYKEHRALLQYGSFKRIRSLREGQTAIWMVISDEGDEALVLYFQEKAKPNPSMDTIKIDGLQEGTYTITNREQYMNIRTTGSLVNHVLPVKLKVNGMILNAIANRYMYKEDVLERTMTSQQLKSAELLLHHSFTGTGTNDQVMIMPDYGSRLFYIKKEKEEND
jgi:alpha-galactosidase